MIKNNKFASKNNSFLNKSIIFGISPCISALLNRRRKCIKIFVTQLLFDRLKDQLSPFSDILSISDSTFIEGIVGQRSHQGIVVIAEKLEMYESKSFFSNNFFSKKNSLIVCLDSITDTGNFGSIIRSSVLFGADCILISKRCAASETSNVAKASCGALELIPIVKTANLVNTIHMLKSHEYWCYGLDCDTKTKTNQIEIKDKKVIFVLGSEDKGIKPIIKSACDFLVKIPVVSNPRIDSLNVSSAASIVLYDYYKTNLIPDQHDDDTIYTS